MNIDPITVATTNEAKQAIEAGADVVILPGSTWCRIFVQNKRADIINYIKHQLGWRLEGSHDRSTKFFAQKTTAGQAQALLQQFVAPQQQPAAAPIDVTRVGRIAE